MGKHHDIFEKITSHKQQSDSGRTHCHICGAPLTNKKIEEYKQKIEKYRTSLFW